MSRIQNIPDAPDHHGDLAVEVPYRDEDIIVYIREADLREIASAFGYALLLPPKVRA